MKEEKDEKEDLLRVDRLDSGIDAFSRNDDGTVNLHQGKQVPGEQGPIIFTKVDPANIDSANINRILRTSFSSLERKWAVKEVAKADPHNIQEVAASQLSIINSYYQSGLEQSQQSFRWSLIWGGVGFAFLLAAVGVLLFRQPTEVAYASGIGGVIVEAFAAIYLYLYKHASDQLAAFRSSLESTQRLLLANSMCERLEGEIEQTTRAELIRLMVSSAVNLQSLPFMQKEKKE